MAKAIPSQGSALKDFLALSRILTGVNGLDANMGRQYLNRLAGTTFEPLLRQVLGAFGLWALIPLQSS